MKLLYRQELEGNFRFPCPCRFVARRSVFTCQFGVGQTMPKNLRHEKHEAVRVVQGIVFCGAVVKSKNLLVYIPAKVEWLYSNVGSSQSSLEQTPEIFDALSMNLSANVLLRVIHNVMDKAVMQLVVAYGIIGVDRGAVLDVVENFVLQGLTLHVRNHLGAYLSQIAVKDALHDCLVKVPTACVQHVFHMLSLVHVSDVTADVGLVGFQRGVWSSTAHLCVVSKLSALHDLADSLEHEPCRRLRDSDRAAKLVRTDTVLGIRQKPKRRHPLIKANGRIFHDGLNLDGELLLAGVAEPELARFDKGVLRRGAARANNVAIRPAESLGKLENPVLIGKVDDGLLQRFRLWDWLRGVHVENDTISAHVCQLVYCQGVGLAK
jgi:hypothetical protein